MPGKFGGIRRWWRIPQPSYYDLPYNILVLVVLGCRWMDNKEWIIEAEQEEKRQAALAVAAAKRGH